MSHDFQNRMENIYSNKVKAGKKRTYFFDVKKTRTNDFFITLTESSKRHESDAVERTKIFLYKEDFNSFVHGLLDTINHVKEELMPDYDYDAPHREFNEDKFERPTYDKNRTFENDKKLDIEEKEMEW